MSWCIGKKDKGWMIDTKTKSKITQSVGEETQISQAKKGGPRQMLQAFSGLGGGVGGNGGCFKAILA